MGVDASTSQITSDPLNPSWIDISFQATQLYLRRKGFEYIYGVPTGGSIVARIVSLHHQRLEILDMDPRALCIEKGKILVVDDLVDSGATLSRYVKAGFVVDALYRKPHSPKGMAANAVEVDGWIRFPWEHSGEPEDVGRRLIEWMGENPRREGLVETPKRYLKAFAELTAGYEENPTEILNKVFTVAYDQMVVVRDIEFWSLCEHHMLPFHGYATVGYIPSRKVVGLSKIPRLVQCFAHRLQVQEALTTQIANALNCALLPRGVGVLIRANHTCMQMRGVKSGGEMVTSCLLGTIRDEARAEFLSLAQR